MELKRGFFFSLISLLLLTGLFFLAQPTPFESTVLLEQSSQERIVFTNAIIDNFERGYLTRAIESQTYLVFEAITEYRNETGSLYTDRDDLEDDFREGLLNGTFDNGAANVTDYLDRIGLVGSQRTLIDLLDLYAVSTSQNYNIRFDFPDDLDLYEVDLFQDEVSGPWQVGVTFSLPYNVSPGVISGGEIATWELDKEVTAYASIRNTRDPYLYIRTQGNVTSRIIEFYTERWSRPAFISFVDNGTYYPYDRSLSFLGRFYDSFEYRSCCGIITTINETRYDAWNDPLVANGAYDNITFTDCGYFPSSSVTPFCRQDADVFVYAVRGLSNYSGPVGGQIVDNASDFPFTIGGRVGSELFNMTIGTDLYDTYEALI